MTLNFPIKCSKTCAYEAGYIDLFPSLSFEPAIPIIFPETSPSLPNCMLYVGLHATIVLPCLNEGIGNHNSETRLLHISHQIVNIGTMGSSLVEVNLKPSELECANDES